MRAATSGSVSALRGEAEPGSGSGRRRSWSRPRSGAGCCSARSPPCTASRARVQPLRLLEHAEPDGRSGHGGGDVGGRDGGQCRPVVGRCTGPAARRAAPARPHAGAYPHGRAVSGAGGLAGSLFGLGCSGSPGRWCRSWRSRAATGRARRSLPGRPTWWVWSRGCRRCQSRWRCCPPGACAAACSPSPSWTRRESRARGGCYRWVPACCSSGSGLRRTARSRTRASRSSSRVWRCADSARHVIPVLTRLIAELLVRVPARPACASPVGGCRPSPPACPGSWPEC